MFRINVGHANHERPHNQKNGFAVKWGETLGEVECPLMRRWVVETPLGSLRLHHFLQGDDRRALHSHPWWFFTLPLKGGYQDVTYCPACQGTGEQERGASCNSCSGSGYAYEAVRPFRPRFRPANHVHAVDTEDCWSLIVTGRKINLWGFIDRAGKFFESRKYFKIFGHAPCE